MGKDGLAISNLRKINKQRSNPYPESYYKNVDFISKPTGSQVLVLSPHLDDALFSAAQLLENTQGDIWTVFAGIPEKGVVTDWDRSLGYNSGRDLVLERRREDDKAFHNFSGEIRQLDFLERAYTDKSTRINDLGILTQLLEDWISSNTGIKSYIFVPAGAGVVMPPPIWKKAQHLVKNRNSQRYLSYSSNEVALTHQTFDSQPQVSLTSKIKEKLLLVAKKILHSIQKRRRRFYQAQGMLANEDHTEIRDLVLKKFSHRTDVVIGLYEELPYAWSKQADSWVNQNIAVSTPLSLQVNRNLKYNRLKWYKTQTLAMDPLGRFEAPHTLPEYEKYWIVDQAY